jgi:hypothetical protein
MVLNLGGSGLMALLSGAQKRAPVPAASDASDQRQGGVGIADRCRLRPLARSALAFRGSARQDHDRVAQFVARGIAHKRASRRAPIRRWRSRGCVGKRRILRAASPALDSATSASLTRAARAIASVCRRSPERTSPMATQESPARRPADDRSAMNAIPVRSTSADARVGRESRALDLGARCRRTFAS